MYTTKIMIKEALKTTMFTSLNLLSYFLYQDKVFIKTNYGDRPDNAIEVDEEADCYHFHTFSSETSVLPIDSTTQVFIDKQSEFF